MSTSLVFAQNQVIIYGGVLVFTTGVFGGFLNTIVLLSLRTFRQSSCAFYLTIMSILNIGQLFTGLFLPVLNILLNIDGTITSLFWCKFRPFIFHVCTATSLTCFCLATIDQYFATCFHHRCQQWCNIKLARRLVLAFIIIWSLHGIPYLLFFAHVQSSVPGKVVCTITNSIFAQYRIYVNFLAISGFLPITVTALFGSMSYFNVQQLIHRTVPLVRRELDKQLTVMVLVQVLINIFILLPYVIVSVLGLNTDISRDLVARANIEFTSTVTLVIYYLYFAVSSTGLCHVSTKVYNTVIYLTMPF